MEYDIKNKFESLVRLLLEYNIALRRMGNKACFISTDNTLKTILDMENPDTEVKFGRFISQLYQTMYESSRYGNNLPNNQKLSTIIKEISQLRHEYGHDRLIGNKREVIKKQMTVGTIFKKYIGKTTPKNKDFLILSNGLLDNLIIIMGKVIDNVEKERVEPEKDIFINTMYNTKTRKNIIQKKIVKKGDFDRLSVTPIFVPTAFWPPEIRSEKECVYIPIDMGLKDHSIDGVKHFIKEVHNFWKNTLSNVMYTRPLFSWSISDTTNNLVYGFGEKSLFKNLKKLTRSVLTIVFTGEYGEGSSNSLVVFGMDFRNNMARYCYVDFYLSSIPLDTHWLESFRNILLKVANNIQGGNSCHFLKTNFRRWQSTTLDLPIGSINTLIGKHEGRGFHYFDHGAYNSDIVPHWELETEWGEVYLIKNPCDNLDELVGFLAPALSEEDFDNKDLRIKRITLSQFNVPGRGGTIPIIFGKIVLD